MSSIELSNVVIEGLKSLNTVISIDLTKKIISNAVKVALHSDASEFYSESYIVSPSTLLTALNSCRYSIESGDLCIEARLHETSRIFGAHVDVFGHQI